MSQQTLAQTRVVDPILSEHARGYRRPGNVARALFPLAPVNQYGGKVIQFGKEAFRLYNAKRAPGSNVKRIDFGYEGAPYAIVPSALEAKVPWERMKDASAVPGINLATRATNLVLSALQLAQEYDSAQLARNGFRFHMGPTILLMPSVLRRIFAEARRPLEDYLTLLPLEPQWRCFFPDNTTLDLVGNADLMRDNLARFANPAVAAGYERFMQTSRRMAAAILR